MRTSALSRRTLGLSAAAAVGLITAEASAYIVNVNTTETHFPPPNGNCSLYEAINLVQGNPDVDACSFQIDGDWDTFIVKLPAGTYTVQEGVYVSGLTLAGSGVSNTTLETDGFPNPTAVFLDGGEIQDLTIRGRNLVGPTVGLYSGENPSIARRIRVTGFNDSGVRNGFYDDKGTPSVYADDEILYGMLTILASTIDVNTSAVGGGGILNSGLLEIRKSTINNNTAPHGGGINQRHGQIFAYYSTISNNRASGGRGGGVHAQPAPNGTGWMAEFNAYHVTIAYNSASQSSGGGGVYVDSSSVWVSNKVNGSIIARNTSGSSNAADDYRGRLRSAGLGYQDGLNANLLGTSSNPAGFQSGLDIVNSSPGLASGLANNGGPTRTIALNSGSPAVNASQNPRTLPGAAGRNYDFSFPTIGDEDSGAADQRGVSLPRPSPNQICDLGAHER